MKAAICIHSCRAEASTIGVSYTASLSDRTEFSTECAVSYSASATQLSSAIRTDVIAKTPGKGLQAADIAVFGGPV